MAIFRSRSREPTRADLAFSGVVLLLVVILLCGVLSLKLSGGFADSVPVTAEMQSAGGSLRTGVDVKMRGMAVGQVTGLEGDARQVRLSLQVGRKHLDEIPSNVRARVLPASVFGTSYVDLVLPSGTPPAEPIRAGDVIEQDTSQEALELQTALDSIDSLVDALGPEELATALHAVSTVLDGRGDDLGVAIDTLNRYTNRFAPMIPRLRKDLRLLAVNLDAVARNAPDLLDATDDARVSLNSLVERRHKFERLLDGGLTLMEDTNELLTEHKSAYLEALSLSVILVDVLYDERGGLRDTLLETGNTSATLLTTLEDGYARVEGYIYASGPDDYTSADCPRYGSLPGGNCG
jgi:phospholipid/cholesterol/gamma-HCH transport system substrate-binding protein